MSGEELPTEVRQFVGRHIETVAELEALLLLQTSAGRNFTAEQVSAELRIDPTAAAEQLARLHAAQLLARADGHPPTYHYDPRPPLLAQTIAALAKAYTDRRVSVISLIYSRPTDQSKLFADAFVFRKDKKDDR